MVETLYAGQPQQANTSPLLSQTQAIAAAHPTPASEAGGIASLALNSFCFFQRLETGLKQEKTLPAKISKHFGEGRRIISGLVTMGITFLNQL